MLWQICGPIPDFCTQDVRDSLYLPPLKRKDLTSSDGGGATYPPRSFAVASLGIPVFLTVVDVVTLLLV
jgi:hypothetical protein